MLTYMLGREEYAVIPFGSLVFYGWSVFGCFRRSVFCFLFSVFFLIFGLLYVGGRESKSCHSSWLINPAFVIHTKATQCFYYHRTYLK